MRERLGMHRYNLTVQMVFSLVLLVLLTAVAAGTPAVLLIRSQIQQQARAQLEQGQETSQALYQSWQRTVSDIATLTAQRPTLLALSQNGSTTELQSYLQTLRQSAEMSLILVCDTAQQPLALAGPVETAVFCRASSEPAFRLLEGEQPELWLLAAQPIGTAVPLRYVVTGIRLDVAFATQMSVQTGLAHSYRWQSVPLASSLHADDGRSYITTTLFLSPNLVDEIALDISDNVAIQRGLIWSLIGSIAIVALIASGVGIFMARRIGQPLEKLADAAAKIRIGDLDTPLAVPSKVRDVTVVTEALEEARLGLRQVVQQLRRANEWTDHLLESIVEGIVTIDRYGRITFFSPGAERITDLHQGDVLGQNCNRVFHPAGSDEPFSQFIPPPGKERKVTLDLSNGRQAVVSITGARLAPPGAGDTGVALVFRDVSESDQMQRLLGQFLANITHEFRTPLSAIAASAELLLDQAVDLSPDELHQLLTSLHLGIVGLQTLVDNLLESASLEVGRFRIYPHPHDLGEIVGEAAQLLNPLLAKYDQRLLVELPMQVPQVQADPRRIMQVLVNLLSNAIKYSPDGSDIQVRATVQGQQARIAVADRGPGVPAGYRPELFRRFARTEPADSKAQYGAGLGLFVVKAIVEAHGGDVGVADRPGGGSYFWFTLPLVNTENGD
ncbi:MAG: PAS domain S-box protein [Anaerolineales bacterium]|nr:PAS domain S-box protein [Anaerolineales bacterium]MCB8990056.1 PAS domain S-box protein [Ardenticatenaceae bacterium]MCB9005633.1 PAS domain S-box protein [Ardenticatenaceae bacterium]